MVTGLAARLMKSRITRIRLPFSKQFESETSATSATSRGVDTSEVRTDGAIISLDHHHYCDPVSQR